MQQHPASGFTAYCTESCFCKKEQTILCSYPRIAYRSAWNEYIMANFFPA